MKFQKFFLKKILFLSTIASLGGCASGPELDKYPRSQIDRPYTLPKGVTTWGIPAIISFSQDEFGKTQFIPPIPVPLFWQTSLSEDWQLSWSPFPLMISHQFNYDETGYTGGFFGLGGGYSSASGALIAPSMGAVYRRKLTNTIALDTQEKFTGRIPFSSGPFLWTSDFQILAFYQLNPLIALSAGPGLTFSNTINLFSKTTPSQTDFQMTIPLTTAFSWSFDRQWNLDVNYQLSVIGQRNGAYWHFGTIQFTHFW